MRFEKPSSLASARTPHIETPDVGTRHFEQAQAVLLAPGDELARKSNA
jgi:hypothetical protein